MSMCVCACMLCTKNEYTRIRRSIGELMYIRIVCVQYFYPIRRSR